MHGPVCQRVFFLLFAAKIERRSSGRDERVFFPLITIAASQANNRKKNPLAPRVSYQLPSLYNVYKEKPIFQNITKKHVHVIFPVLILFVQSTHMERILTGLGGLVWKILRASGNIQLRACFQAQKKSTSLVSVFGTYVKTERLKKLKSLPRGLMVLILIGEKHTFKFLKFNGLNLVFSCLRRKSDIVITKREKTLIIYDNFIY